MSSIVVKLSPTPRQEITFKTQKFFWTVFYCINCIHSLGGVKLWTEIRRIPKPSPILESKNGRVSTVANQHTKVVWWHMAWTPSDLLGISTVQLSYQPCSTHQLFSDQLLFGQLFSYQLLSGQFFPDQLTCHERLLARCFLISCLRRSCFMISFFLISCLLFSWFAKSIFSPVDLWSAVFW